MTITNAVLVASGDLRETANRLCWPAQAELERNIEAAFARHGVTVRRAHPVDQAAGHGFISSQRMGMDVFAGIDRGCAHHRGRGGLAVQPSRPARSSSTSWADPDRRQLERRSGRDSWACSTSTHP